MKLLLEEGKRKGYLTYGEMNRILAEEFISPDRIDQVLTILDENGIDLVDEAEAPEASEEDSPADFASGAEEEEETVADFQERCIWTQADALDRRAAVEERPVAALDVFPDRGV